MFAIAVSMQSGAMGQSWLVVTGRSRESSLVTQSMRVVLITLCATTFTFMGKDISDFLSNTLPQAIAGVDQIKAQKKLLVSGRTGIMRRLTLMLVFICSSFAANGQQPPNNGSPCPSGMIPGYGTCYSPSDPDRDGGNTQAAGRTEPLWQDRFGAIAVDSKTGSAGWISNARSKQEAYKGAVDDCGGGGCEVRIQVRNGCVAAAWGGGVSSYAAKANLREAEAVAMEKCKNNGAGALCKVQYSACSLPVRIR